MSEGWNRQQEANVMDMLWKRAAVNRVIDETARYCLVIVLHRELGAKWNKGMLNVKG